MATSTLFSTHQFYKYEVKVVDGIVLSWIKSALAGLSSRTRIKARLISGTLYRVGDGKLPLRGLDPVCVGVVQRGHVNLPDERIGHGQPNRRQKQ
ncbi:hypothetical protein FPSE_07982 [Fusarium pseudograminearum CS3096]|uniref:Uncharacterized protein n=1 Tax=Fusarium pseudograminearum (strain CS3096) TaxID=1028729 RepID=K3UJ11_FUSPC|nr:hypothetical protein FPSE_07982 [Fusarium pseudograminearum CS3096]EKJ71881.1 hypothetical protein FPSE_07982 [Fusarium pseudograminearum CS3096]